MDPKKMANNLATGRIVFGIAFMAAPALTGRVWIGSDAQLAGPRVLTQAIGARDLTMGLGALIAMRRGKPVRGWFEAISLTDALDFACALAAGDRIPPACRVAVLALAGSSAAQAAYAASGVDDS
ncbi:MAG TPA: hypothetical protein VF545_04650 [Thermoleophilaceae bacterium]